MDNEPLTVSGLKPGRYELRIDGTVVGTFDASQLGAGVNLAALHTPMADQARRVLDLTWKHTAWRFFAWRGIQTQLSFDHDPAVQSAVASLVAALRAQELEIEQHEYAAAKPHVTHYTLAALAD